jgi:hypothetical protein
MNSFRFNFQVDYIFFEKKNTNLYLGIGVGYSKTNISSLQKFGYKHFQQYYSREGTTKYSNNTIFILPNFGVDYSFSKHIKANINLNMFLPFSKTLDRSGYYSYDYSNQPFNGIYSNVDVPVNDNLKNISTIINPIQIGVNFGIIYSIK